MASQCKTQVTADSNLNNFFKVGFILSETYNTCILYVSIHVFMSQILSKQKLQDYEISYESNEYPQH